MSIGMAEEEEKKELTFPFLRRGKGAKRTEKNASKIWGEAHVREREFRRGKGDANAR